MFAATASGYSNVIPTVFSDSAVTVTVANTNKAQAATASWTIVPHTSSEPRRRRQATAAPTSAIPAEKISGSVCGVYWMTIDTRDIGGIPDKDTVGRNAF